MPSASETTAIAVTNGVLKSVRRANVRLRIQALDEPMSCGVYRLQRNARLATSGCSLDGGVTMRWSCGDHPMRPRATKGSDNKSRDLSFLDLYSPSKIADFNFDRSPWSNVTSVSCPTVANAARCESAQSLVAGGRDEARSRGRCRRGLRRGDGPVRHLGCFMPG
jgi:hypothetical protein